MEAPIALTERRLSSVIAPPWLQPNKQTHASVFATTPEEGSNGNRKMSDILIRENCYPIDINHSRSAVEKRSEFARQQESMCAYF